MRPSVVWVFALTLSAGLAVETANATDEAAIKLVTGQLLKAYHDEDAKEFAQLFTAEGEYVDLKGSVFHGRSAIETEFAAFFRDMPDATMQLDFTAVRSIAPGIVVAECVTKFKKTAESAPISGRCQLICTREAHLWRIASLREIDVSNDAVSHHAKVSQLEWLVGEWLGEGAHFQVHFSCRWDESKNYLLRDFKVESGGPRPLTGTQRIGYDPLTRQLKIWAFDSAGGYSEGTIEQSGDLWLVRTSGVTPDGRAASSTNSLERLDDHRISSSIVDRMIGGERKGEAESLTLIRKPNRTLNRASAVDVSAKPQDSDTVPGATTNRK